MSLSVSPSLATVRASAPVPGRSRRYRSAPGRHLQIFLADCPRPSQAAAHMRLHPAVDVIFGRDPLRVPEGGRDPAPGQPLRLAFQRQQKLVIVPLRARPERGAGTPSQASSMRSSCRPTIRPSSAEITVPARRRTISATSSPCSILSTSAPSARRRPESVAPPSAASCARGRASRRTSPSITPAWAQKGACGNAAYGSSHASMPQAMAARSTEV